MLKKLYSIWIFINVAYTTQVQITMSAYTGVVVLVKKIYYTETLVKILLITILYS